MLGRTVVLRGSSGCLNTGSCSFHLVVAKERRVVQGINVVLCYTIWCLCDWRLVLEHLGSWCFLLVGAREIKELVLENPESWCSLEVAACKIEVVASL